MIQARFLVAAFLFLVLFSGMVFAQNVGIGTVLPRATLHINAPDSNLLILNNRSNLNTNVTNSLFFRTGTTYTGAIKTIGNNNNSARLSLFTFADSDSTKLRERITILDNGWVGIGINNPTSFLDVGGSGRFWGSGNPNAGVTGHNSGGSYYNAGVRGNSDAMGIIGQAFTEGGIGVAGLNLGDGGNPDFLAGVGVMGYSRTGHGVFGRTTRSGGYAGVYGSAYGNETVGGLFSSGSSDGFTNTLALRTIGPVRLGGIGEAPGRVLTSDGSGNATWQPLPGPAKGFLAYLSNNTSLTNGANIILGNMTEIFDEGNLFTNGANSFTVPETGLYSATLNMFLSNTNLTTSSTIASNFVVNGTDYLMTTFITLQPAIGSGTWSNYQVNSRLLKLNAGDVITVKIRPSFSSGSITIRGETALSNTTTLSIHQVK